MNENPYRTEYCYYLEVTPYPFSNLDTYHVTLQNNFIPQLERTKQTLHIKPWHSEKSHLDDDGRFLLKFFSVFISLYM